MATLVAAWARADSQTPQQTAVDGGANLDLEFSNNNETVGFD